VAAGLRPHRLHQVLFVADEAARFAADRLQVPHSQVQAVFGGRSEVMTRLGRDGKLPHWCAEKKLGGGQPGLARVGQRQHHRLTRLSLLLRDEIADRLEVEFFVGGQQIHVQHD
jgi:hypothetical protein